MPYSLVVVDMQESFKSAAKQSVQKSCLNLIHKAMQDKAAIIFLEYKECGNTHKKLLDAIKKYSRAYTIKKNKNDGSNQVVKIINKYNLPKKNIKIAGVNTNYCVRETIEGLLDKHRIYGYAKNIEVTKSGTNCTWAHKVGIQYFKTLYKVRVID